MRWMIGLGLMLMIIPGLFGQELKDQLTPGDTTTLEYWRKKGYEARLNGKTEASQFAYLKVLELDPDDWDASLAVARICFSKEDYTSAIHHYNTVVRYDSTHDESLWGIGRCQYRLGNFEEAASWYYKALVYLPGHLPLLEDLSYALVNSGRQEDALDVYLRMIEANPDIAMAWAGAGRVYQLSGKPATAARHLAKALELDPGNKEIEALYRQAKNQMAFSLTLQYMYINENEPINMGSDTMAYNIDAIIQKINVSKRISDRFFLTFSNLVDNSNRAYYDQPDTNRWFDNTFLRGTYITGNHSLNLHAGGSLVEQQLTTYGLSWDYAKRIRKIRISNSLSAGYDYYYYWNQVGHDFIRDQFVLTCKNFTLDAHYRYVNVRALETDTLGRNPGHQYTVALRYTFFKNPKITPGIYYHYRDYEYRSPRFWSAQERKQYGATLSLYADIVKGLYFWGSVNIGKAYEKDRDDVEHWEVAADMGYNFRSWSFSAGAARFYNPWYENFITYLSVTKRFTKTS